MPINSDESGLSNKWYEYTGVEDLRHSELRQSELREFLLAHRAVTRNLLLGGGARDNTGGHT